jgi:hypothetical protein
MASFQKNAMGGVLSGSHTTSECDTLFSKIWRNGAYNSVSLFLPVAYDVLSMQDCFM